MTLQPSTPALAPNAEAIAAEVLSAYALTGARIEPLPTGSYNHHFRVEARESIFDLRRSKYPCTPENLLYEASLLEHLHSKGFHLAPRIFPAADGRANVWFDGAGWTLFHWIGDGPKVRRQELTAQRWVNAARTLARLHLVAWDFEPQGQRGDWPVFSGPKEWPQRWLPRAESLAKELGEAGQSLRFLARRSAEELSALDYSRLPDTLCHGDYRMANLMFEGDAVAAVFDFDVTFRTTRLLDLARLVAGFDRNTNAPDVEGSIGALRAYNEAAPVRPYEWEALPAFIRWRLIRDAVAVDDDWWLTLGLTVEALFDGAADAIVEGARAV